jgi:hypothetical protein
MATARLSLPRTLKIWLKSPIRLTPMVESLCHYSNSRKIYRFNRRSRRTSTTCHPKKLTQGPPTIPVMWTWAREWTVVEKIATNFQSYYKVKVIIIVTRIEKKALILVLRTWMSILAPRPTTILIRIITQTLIRIFAY